jgi:hypothetical protein
VSTLAYGVISAQRQAEDPGKSKEAKGSPGFGSYIDVVAALVPAEILAANAALIPIMTSSSTDDGGNPITTITDISTLKVVFWLSVVASVVLYGAAHWSRASKEETEADGDVEVSKWGFGNVLRALIPAGAYVGWTMLQQSTAFDAVAPDMSEALRLTIAVFAALGLAALAKVLSDRADEASPTPEPDEPPPADPVPDTI